MSDEKKFTPPITVLIWMAEDDTPTSPDFKAAGAVSFESLPEAVVRAQAESAARPEKPWLLSSGVIIGPEQIKLLHAKEAR